MKSAPIDFDNLRAGTRHEEALVEKIEGLIEDEGTYTLEGYRREDGDEGSGEGNDDGYDESDDAQFAREAPDKLQPPEEDGDEHAENDDDVDEPSAEPTFRVKVNGEEIEVSQDELIRGYSRHGDYTRKTQALATERRGVEELARIHSTAAEAYAQRLEAIARVVPPAQLGAIEAEYTQVRHHQAQQEHVQLVQEMATEKELLKEAILEWKDAERAKSEKHDLVKYLTDTYGFSRNELDAVTDHRLMVIPPKGRGVRQADEG